MKIVFLDRDGVINKFPGNGNYVTLVKEFQFLPGSLEAIRLLTEQGYTIFVVSNQAGVGKGIFSKDKLKKITAKMMREIKKSGGKIKRVYYSTSKSDAGCEYRKPNIGSIRKAFESLKKPLQIAKKTYFVGDTETDIQAGHNAGCKTIFVLSGREDKSYLKRKWSVMPDFIANDLLEATKIITAQKKPSPNAKKRRVAISRALTKELNGKIKISNGNNGNGKISKPKASSRKKLK